MKNALLLWLLPFLLSLHFVRAQSPTAGYALSFQGTTSVIIRHDPALNPFPLTATAWIKTTQGSGGVVNKYLSGAFCGWHLYLANGEIRAWYFADATNNVWDGADGLNGGPVADGKWHHLAFTVDADGGTIYVDGVPTASRVWNGTPTRTAGVQDMSLGVYPGAGPNFYRGLMDEVTVWNVRLSRAAIGELSRRSLRGDEAGLVAYYRCDEADGVLVQDSGPLDGHQAGLINGAMIRMPSNAPLIPAVATNGLPVILRIPAGQEAEAGTAVTFEAQDGPGIWNHQWSRDGQELPLATGTTLMLPAVSPDDAGDYRVRSWNDSQSVVSLPASLHVLTVPELVSQPVSELADVGATVTFAPVAMGGRPMSFRWYRDSVLLDGASSNALTLSPVHPGDAGNYQLVVGNSYGAVTSRVARLNVSARHLTNGLVLHLNFDGQLNDSSGRGNHAAYAFSGPNAKPSPTFVAGRIGQAFQFTTTSDGQRFEYATLGYPPDLQLGAEDDFSVSLWVNYSTQGGDLPFLSNKDWDKSHKPGWAITTQGGGNFRLNASGPNRGADFFTTATTPVIRNAAWHHLLICFQRTDGSRSAWVYTYVDGALVNRTAMSLSGTVDTLALPFSYASPRVSKQTSWALNIGQDGTGVYFDKGGASAIGAKMDDLGIWRRALSAEEARAIFVAGRAGLDLSQAVVPPRLFISQADGFISLSWSGDPGNQVETTTDLTSGAWMPLPGVANTNAVSLPVGDQPAYFWVVP
jgi:hypothetical protein